MVDTFSSTFTYTDTVEGDIHNMMSNVQQHTVASAQPPATNHNFAYLYGDSAKPHRATKIGDTFFTYDNNGNTARECSGPSAEATCSATHAQLRQYFWDEDNRVTDIVDGGGQNTTKFLYDAAGDRVVKQGGGGNSITIGQWFNLKGPIAATKHIYAGETRIAAKLLPPAAWFDVQEPGVTLTTRAEGTATGKATTTSTTMVRPETFYYHADHLGSTSWVTDQNGKVYEHVEYFPFGAVWRDARSDSDRGPVQRQQFVFTSKEFDQETGLYYFGARYYDPRRARWVSPEPDLGVFIPDVRDPHAPLPADGVFDPKNLSVYAYSSLNPIVYVDPNGLWSWKHAGKGFVKGAAGGLVGGALVAGLIAAGLPVIAGAVVVVGVVGAGVTAYEAIRERSIVDGRGLTDEEVSDRWGQLAGGVVGGLAGFKGGRLLFGTKPAPGVRMDTPPIPEGMSRAEFGKLLAWPTPSNKSGGPMPSPKDLAAKGVTKQMLLKWQKFYKNEAAARNPQNPSAGDRVRYLQDIIDIFED